MATNEQPEDRWETIKAIWAKDEHRWLYVIVGLVAGFLLGVTIRDFILDNPGWRETLANLFPEAFGISVTVLVLNGLADRRTRLEEKRDLIFKMGSSIREIAVPASEALRRHGWLQNGSLKKANLRYADLQGANLENANLQGADLWCAKLQMADLSRARLQEVDLRAWLEGAKLDEADLQGADLTGANLQKAHFVEANLQEVMLHNANLQEARIWIANLQGADLLAAKLQGANLSYANLQGVKHLSQAYFDKDTILPDGTNRSALEREQLDRFTDPNHPNFWRPEPGSVWWYPAEEAQHGDE